MLAAGFVAAYFKGVLGLPFAGDNAPVCAIILLMGAVGIGCSALRRWKDVNWLATHVVRIGLLGTVIGLIIAFSVAGAAGNAADVKPLIAQVIAGMYVSLYATLLGIGTNLWLKLNMKLLGNDSEHNLISPKRMKKLMDTAMADCKSGSGSKSVPQSKSAGSSGRSHGA